MNEELACLLNKIKRGMGKVFYTARAVHSRDSSCLPLRQVEWQVLTCIQGKSSPIRRERPHFPTLELPSIISDPCHQPYMLIRRAYAHLYQFTPGYSPLWIRAKSSSSTKSPPTGLSPVSSPRLNLAPSIGGSLFQPPLAAHRLHARPRESLG